MSNDISSDIPKRLAPGGRTIGTLIVVVFTFLIFLVSQFIALFIALCINTVMTGQFSSDNLSNSASGQFFYILLAESLAVGGVWWLLHLFKLKFSDIGFARLPRWRDLSWAAMAFTLFIITLVIATAIISALWHGYNTNQTQDVGFSNSINGLDKLIAFFSLVVLPPLGEETLVRGYLYTALRSRWGFVTSGLMTSVLFGAAHLLTGQNGLLWSAAVDTFILSLFLVYLREKTGALYAGMVLHALNNVLAFFVFFHS